MTGSDSKLLKSYGVLKQSLAGDLLSTCLESVRINGFAVYDPGFSKTKIDEISTVFNQIQTDYIVEYGRSYLKKIDEINTVRLPMSFDLHSMCEIALNAKLLSVVDNLIDGKYILNQQNLICNPSQQSYNQSSWHRDLPYQHFTSSSPLAINAIYCVDDFTNENGASFVLPFSHKQNSFPSEHYVNCNELQVEASAGCYIILDCMTFHRGGYNTTAHSRRAINQVYTIPYFKQQICIESSIDTSSLEEHVCELLGFYYKEPRSVKDYLNSRVSK